MHGSCYGRILFLRGASIIHIMPFVLRSDHKFRDAGNVYCRLAPKHFSESRSPGPSVYRLHTISTADSGAGDIHGAPGMYALWIWEYKRVQASEEGLRETKNDDRLISSAWTRQIR